MTEDLNSLLDSTFAIDATLAIEFEKLWAEAAELWNRHQNAPAFHAYVSADYLAVYESLARLRGHVTSVLEWGSGLGIVTIMASRLGFDACGIEAESGLVAHAEKLAQKYGPGARFAVGNFIPDEFQSNPADRSDHCRSVINAASAYADLNRGLRDFDLVYAYPWPAERALYGSILRDCGGRDAMLLTYDARKGMNLARFPRG